MQSRYAELKAGWLTGDRNRDRAFELMFHAWMNWVEPGFVTGMEDDPDAPALWKDAFEHFGGERSDDPEFLFAAGIMARIGSYGLGDDLEWERRGDLLLARARELQPSGFSPDVFEGRGEYGAYFADRTDLFHEPPEVEHLPIPGVLDQRLKSKRRGLRALVAWLRRASA